jgi:predicted enzyme related to lactoylglutathione lyase
VVNPHGRFAWYELMTTDVEAAKAFYTRVMGWDVWDASAPGRAYALFTTGKASAGGVMELPEDARTMGATPGWVGYVGVDDVDATAGRIERLGGVVHVPPTDVPDISRFSVFADPQTARLALFKWLNPGQAPPAEQGAPGHVGWHELLADDWEKALAFYCELFGWQKADSDIGELGTYQLFSAGGQTIGGMVPKPPTMPAPFWLYYFNVGDIDAAAQRVKTGGGQILEGPFEVAGGSWIVLCTDPQGAMFALEGMRGRNPIGYFERVGSRDASDPRGRRWSW